MSFRLRLTLVAAVAVAVSVALAAVLMYLGVQSQLVSEVDNSLKSRADLFAGLSFGVNGGTVIIRPGGGQIPGPELGGAAGYAQLVTAAGQTLRPGGGSTILPVDARTRAVAAGSKDAFFRDETVGGTHIRVLTAPIRTGLAVQIARPLTEVDSTLHRLLIILIAVTAGGILLAATVGALVARAAVAPVRRLSEATEHVTSTRDLSRRIEAGGKDELGQLAGNFNEMMGALEESQRAQRQLVADASHELRTPLTSLRTNIEVLARDSLPTPDREALLADVVSELEELSILVGDLVDLAREDELEEAHEDVRLDLLVAEAVERARRRSPGLEFTVALEPTIVDGVPARLDRAVSNLLDNAVKWSPPGGVVDVTVANGEVVVHDHGPGIPEADLPFVFDRFYRAPDARGLPGSGLGLAIVRQVAEAHGGFAEARNAADGGAELRLKLLSTS